MDSRCDDAKSIDDPPRDGLCRRRCGHVVTIWPTLRCGNRWDAGLEAATLAEPENDAPGSRRGADYSRNNVDCSGLDWLLDGPWRDRLDD
jgi:hypothetical protein